MEEQINQTQEDVVMLDDKKKVFLKNSLGIKLNTFEVFDDLIIDYIASISNLIQKDKKLKNDSSFFYLMIWSNKKHLLELKNKNISIYSRVGRGLAFHVCPNNVPMNFIYSYFFGLLSGNSNIIKIPSRNFNEKNKILSLIKKSFENKKFKKIKDSNRFVEFDSTSSSLPSKISLVADIKIIWGSDKTIKQIKNLKENPRCINISFPDRISLAIFNTNKLKLLKKNSFKTLVKNFYNDSYFMNQLACNSPHYVFWISGNKNLKVIQNFWNELYNVSKKIFMFNEIDAVNKKMRQIDILLKNNKFKIKEEFLNNLTVIDTNQDKKFYIDSERGINGIFFEKNINNLNDLSKFITKKTQTILSWGVGDKDFKNFILKKNITGVDRVVNIGKGFDIDLNWDGYSLINTLSRVIRFDNDI